MESNRVTVTLDPASDRRWEAFLDRCPGAEVFHHPQWLCLLRDRYRYAMTAVCVEDADGGIAAAVPLARVRSPLTGSRLVALPFSDTCAPLLRVGASPASEAALAQALRDEQRHRGIDLEVRAPVRGLGGSTGRCFHHHVLPLGKDHQAVQDGFSKSQVRRGTRKAIREGVTVEQAKDRAALDAFFRLHLQTRRRQGVPTQPRRFIRDFEGLFRRGLGFVMTARWEGRPIAAAIFLTYNGTLTYKYGASDRPYLDKRPNQLLFSEAIRWGCANGMHTLDFGRTDLDNEGLRSFKRSWGAEERTLAYTRLEARPRRSRVAAPSGRLRVVIQRSPAGVGQLVGAALYKHFG